MKIKTWKLKLKIFSSTNYNTEKMMTFFWVLSLTAEKIISFFQLRKYPMRIKVKNVYFINNFSFKNKSLKNFHFQFKID